MPAPRFVHLRMHSEYSVTDGIVRIDDAVEFAAADAMPALAEPSPPLAVTGRVKFAFDGVYANLGPMRKGIFNNTGTTVVLEVAGVDIVVISRHQEPYDLSCLLSVGIDPRHKRHVILKSRVHWRAGMGEIAGTVIECAGLGVCTSDYGQLSFARVRRPIYPLDPL